ncbi:MAG TPA: hypothetical protein VMQ59_03055 [Acidimicrobiales bacterium]|nr:hypothetical protein [Acidimicrobiales bacterium]
MAVTSLLVAPTVAGAAASCGSMSGVSCSVTPVIAGSSTSSAAPTASALPNTGPAASTAPTTTTSSLPFTGADVEELAVVGAGAVLAGALLMRRRRQPA